MRPILLALTVIGVLSTCGLQTGYAQQRQRQLRPVTITYRSTAIQRTQWSPDSGTSNVTSTAQANPNESPAPASGSPEKPSVTAGQQNQFTPGFSSGQTNGGSFNNADQRPTLQQLQNPSGGFNMTHSNFSQSQYTSPNNYFGPQQNDWSNLRTLPANLSSFESFNRYQPDTNSGGYYSPNTYIGSMNNQWSNLSAGSITPSDQGGWTMNP